MKYHKKFEDPILQSEKFIMSTGTTVRIQVKESSYVITLNLDTDMYKNLRMNTFKKGVRISSSLKKFPKKKISKTIIMTRDLMNPSQLVEDTIIIDDEYYVMTIVIRLSDFIRNDVKKLVKRYLCNKNHLN